MPSSLESAFQASAARINHFIEVHRDHPGVSFSEHVKRRQREKVAHASSFKLIYLDTLAWKCLADYRQGKPTLTEGMKEFGASIEQAVQTGRFAFPIGLPTYYELASMADPLTQGMLRVLVDELSHGICIPPHHDRVGFELEALRMGNINEDERLDTFLCSPIEMMGIPIIPLPAFVKAYVDQTTFNKALFDALFELPFSIQLKIASETPRKWDNSRGIAALNDGKALYQSDVPSLNAGIFLELKGGIEAWFINEEKPLNYEQINLYAQNAMSFWKQNPASQALPTLLILSSLYGLMRFDPNRRYKNGDPNDYLVAATALPIAKALFTDRKFATLLSDKRIGLDRFTNCIIVSGFEEMSQHLKEQMKY